MTDSEALECAKKLKEYYADKCDYNDSGGVASCNNCGVNPKIDMCDGMCRRGQGVFDYIIESLGSAVNDKR